MAKEMVLDVDLVTDSDLGLVMAPAVVTESAMDAVKASASDVEKVLELEE